MKKFAYILMGSGFEPDVHRSRFETAGGITCIFTVRDFDEAKALAKYCLGDGFGVIELCGAFGEERARELIDITEGKIGVGFVKNLPEQAEIFGRFFSHDGEG